jgi:hypothetical protein
LHQSGRSLWIGPECLPAHSSSIAVAALRDNDRTTAKTILADLSREFPANRLYQKELARIQ